MTQRATTGPSGQSYVEADDVFDLLFDDPADAAEARARAVLVEYLREAIAGWTQEAAAARLGTTQPRVSALVRGKIEAFSLSTLVKYVTRLGAQPIVTVRAERPSGGGASPVAAGATYIRAVEDAPAGGAGVSAGDPFQGAVSAVHVAMGPGAVAATDYSFQLAA